MKLLTFMLPKTQKLLQLLEVNFSVTCLAPFSAGRKGENLSQIGELYRCDIVVDHTVN